MDRCVLMPVRAWRGFLRHLIVEGDPDGRWSRALCGFAPLRAGSKKSKASSVAGRYWPDGWHSDAGAYRDCLECNEAVNVALRRGGEG